MLGLTSLILRPTPGKVPLGERCVSRRRQVAQKRRQILLLLSLSAWGCLFVCVCLFAFSRAAPTAYGGSQARGLIGAVAASLRQSHSNAESEPCL